MCDVLYFSIIVEEENPKEDPNCGHLRSGNGQNRDFLESITLAAIHSVERYASRS